MNRSTRVLRQHTLAAAVALALVGAAQAQLSSSTVRGRISGAVATPAGTLVTAVNKANGARYSTTTQADGSYVLSGLAPGEYEIRVAAPGGSAQSQSITLAVGETAALDLSVGGQVVTIVGQAQRQGVRSSEVGTAVSPRVIQAMPQTSRNFLSFADLAPGVRFDTDANGVVTVRGGAQDQNNINIYIDGVSQKNNILRGGAGGMDSSRGNPFPQAAVAEYRVISQNYKAEFDQVSSTAITAVTKSGGNQLHGEVFVDYLKDSFVAYNPIEEQNRANGFDRAKFKQVQSGFSLGGAIKEDVAHYFLSYEGKDIATPRNVGFASLGTLLPRTGLAGSLYALQGSHTQKFTENMLFAKFDLNVGVDQHLDITLRVRDEKDLIAENPGLSAPGNDKARNVGETRIDLRHVTTRGQFVNEARLGYETYKWNPQGSSSDPEIKYSVSATNLDDGSRRDVIWTGGSPDAQNRKQSGLLLQDDFSYNGLSGHAIKTGAKLKMMEYDLSGTSRGVDILYKLLHNTTGNPIIGMDTSNPTADWYRREAALPATRVNYKNNQLGLYMQDDWRVSSQLELNVGVRWDYESNPLNNGYVTPAALVTALNRVDIPRYGITPPAGQTYAQSLARGGININDYISTGNNRKQFYGAIAPRLGLSFDVLGDKATVIYGGWGRAYDRAMANYALDELQRQLSTGDQFMIRNDYKTPYSDQFSAGLRQALGQWNGELGVNYTHAKHQFNWVPGDRDPNGGFGPRANSIDPNWGAGPQGYGMLILGDFVTQQKTTQVFVRADKPYTRASGWQAGVTYTYSDAKTTHRDWNDDIFNWSYGKPGETGGFRPSRLVEEHRIVASGLTDGLLPWGLTVGGKATIGSGLPYRITACPTSWDACQSFLGKADWTKQFDLSLSKSFKVPGGDFSLRLDMLNVFNTVNWTGYNDWGGGPGAPRNWTGGDNADLGQRNGVGLPMRTYKLSMRYVF